MNNHDLPDFICHRWRRLGVALGCLALLAGPWGGGAWAADEGQPVAVEPERPLIDSARSQTQSWSERLARRVDSWFGDLPFEDGGAGLDQPARGPLLSGRPGCHGG